MTVPASTAWVLMNSSIPVRVYLNAERANEDMNLMAQTRSEDDYWHLEEVCLMMRKFTLDSPEWNREKAEAAS